MGGDPVLKEMDKHHPVGIFMEHLPCRLELGAFPIPSPSVTQVKEVALKNCWWLDPVLLNDSSEGIYTNKEVALKTCWLLGLHSLMA